MSVCLGSLRLHHRILDYSIEPEEVFFPLSAQRYCEFYDIEMMNFDADLGFYLSALEEKKDILELGCGSGRLSRALATRGHRVTGVDISREMLARASMQDTTDIAYICADMAEISLQKNFDAIIIPYNTLNLLREPGKVELCLQLIRNHLRPNGLLLLQTFLPGQSIPTENAKTFQFQIFKTPDGGKIIKETFKYYRVEEQLIILQERYRVRPITGKTEDLIHTLYLLALPYEAWIRLITGAGFTINAQYGDYTLSPFIAGKDSRLLLTARAR
jgi:2-polyprenyl-3-methyl-5-hydroxy-6-metoxy-1,4-benzoquinol methylase